MKESTPPKIIQKRSPKYPAYNIEEAIKKAKILFQKDGKVGAPSDVALKHLGYSSPTSGSALRTIATLRQFGLTTEKDGRTILTEPALDLVLYSNGDERFERSLKACSIKPKLFSKLYFKYGFNLPSDEAIRAELIREYDFNQNKVTDFIKSFRQTLEYAGLLTKDTVPAEPKDVQEESESEIEGRDEMEDQVVDQKEKTGSKGSQLTKPQTLQILLTGQNRVALSFEKLPISKDDLNILKQWIELMTIPLTAQQSSEPTPQQ